MASATTVEHKEQRANNISACKAWPMYMNVRTITHDPFTASINNIYYATLDDPVEGLNAVTLHQLDTHICTEYAQISQTNLNNNVTNFKQESIQTFSLLSTCASWKSARHLCRTLAYPSLRK
jgi:hypothetical protein